MLKKLQFGKSRKEPEATSERVPPGQFVTEKFPVLTYGDTPKIDLKTWRFRVFGKVEREIELSWEEFMKLPQSKVVADFHCVTQWSRLDNTWEGVLSKDLMKLVKPLPQAKHVMVHCYGGYTTNIPFVVLADDDVLFAHRHDGKPLEPDHGWPLRLVVPKRYGWKSAKWVNGVEFIEQDEPGFWERIGYHNNANPWKEERFWPEIDGGLKMMQPVEPGT